MFSFIQQVCKTHSGILGKGLALSHSPTILEALEGNLPLQIQSNEQSFLDDFIACVPGSSGGRLARYCTLSTTITTFFQGLPQFSFLQRNERGIIRM